MRSLIFNSLTIASPSQKCANRFEFHPQFNLITGPDNSIGKSTLVKLLLWTFGCEPGLDSTWTSTESRCILEFTLDGKLCALGRYGNTITLKEVGQPFERYERITGEYSRRFANLVDFNVLLPNRSDPPELEFPPPAYYFLPFYIDQRRSWSAAWSGLNDLAQYASWQRPVISYHTGYLAPEHFQYASQIAIEVAAIKVGKKSIERISGAIAVVEEIAPAVKTASTGRPVEELISEIGDDVGALHQELDRDIQSLTLVREQVAQLTAQRHLLDAAAGDLGLDYTFAAENTSGDRLECPLCGTLHDNTLIERAGLLAEKAAAEDQRRTIMEKELVLRQKASRIEGRVRILRRMIDDYSVQFEAPEYSDNTNGDFMARLSSGAIQKMALKTKGEAEARVAQREKEGRRLKSLQRKLLSKEDKTRLDDRFLSLLRLNVDNLGAAGVNLSGVDSPLSFTRLFGSGGAAEATRAALAYYLSVHTMVQEADNEVISPLIVDTPNQHEQTDYNYEAALQLIKQKMLSSQVFVCAMNTDVIQQYKDLGKVTWLEPGDRLLHPSKFSELWPRVERFFAQTD